jgi:hypothetical protein
VVRWHASPTLPAPGQLQQYGQCYRGAFRAPRLDNRTKLSRSKVRKMLKATETIFKHGVRVPKGDRDARTLPDAVRWKAGRDLEWMRLKSMGTFDGNWTWTRVQREFPKFTKSEIGHLFYVYDYKYSGERRVRCVCDGSKQSPLTYSDTHAPTVRPESIRFFHMCCVEHSRHIGQFDVPCAFLQSESDCDIFVYLPEGNSEGPGQILRL